MYSPRLYRVDVVAQGSGNEYVQPLHRVPGIMMYPGLPEDYEPKVVSDTLPSKEQTTLKGHDGPVLSVRFNTQGTYCLTGGKVMNHPCNTCMESCNPCASMACMNEAECTTDSVLSCRIATYAYGTHTKGRKSRHIQAMDMKSGM